jgi:hypothetical protein
VLFIGTYIATCGFDKTVSVFDFFSGELITQVSGHSELITGVKFSPDGRHLVTIGGDGCIFMWRVADSLVKTMQDRLMELMTNAQRRDVKAAAAVRKSVVGSAQAHLEAPPPLPAPSHGLPAQPQAASRAMPPIPSSPALIEGSRASGSGMPRSRWAERVEQDHGYELFGKKIDPAAAPPDRNKFTLELTETTRANIAAPAASAAEAVDTEESAVTGVGLGSSTRRGDALEAEDDVMQSALSGSDTEDEGDGSEMFKPVKGSADTAEDYISDFEAPSTDAAGHGPGLDMPVEDLDNWLESMVSGCMTSQCADVLNVLHVELPQIRSEGKLAPAAAEPIPDLPAAPPMAAAEEPKRVHNRRVVNKATGEVSSRPIPAAGSADGGDMLQQSLSSAYFLNLRNRPAAVTVGERHPSEQPRFTASSAAAASEAESPAQAMERRKRETAAALAQMQGRLRVMGILEPTQRAEPDAEEDPSPFPANVSTRSPQSKAETVASTPKPDDDGYDTASTASEPDSGADNSSSQLDQSTLIVNEISQKAADYRRVLK